ncbi:MAG: hypothetical protein ACKOYL_03075 [Actinomycetota bacterium]
MRARRAVAALAVPIVLAFVSHAHASSDPNVTTTVANEQVDEPVDEQGGVSVPTSVVSVSTVPSATTTVPVGCPPAPVSQAVFVGKVKVLDATQALYELVRLRSGSLAGYSTEVPNVDGTVVTEVGIYYGRDVKFLEVGDSYLVGTALDATTGRIFSRVTEEAPLFGGNEVADINNAGVVCPNFADVARTLNVDGSSVESGVLSGLSGESDRIILALVIPAGLVLLGLVTLVLIRRSLR